MLASQTVLAEMLRRERERDAIAKRVLSDVLLSYRASADVKSAALCLLGWLSRRAEEMAEEEAKHTEKAG